MKVESYDAYSSPCAICLAGRPRVEQCDSCEYRHLINLREAGRLKELPCKVGDKIYVIAATLDKKTREKAGEVILVYTVKYFTVDNRDEVYATAYDGRNWIDVPVSKVITSLDEAREKLAQKKGAAQNE